MKWIHGAILVTMILLAVAAGQARAQEMPGREPAAPTDTVDVTAVNFSFVPSSVTITAGDSVRWSNGGGFHNVVADDSSFRCANGCDGAGGNGDPATNAWTATVTFDTPGIYPYFCQIHGAPGGVGMSGTVIVEAPPAVTTWEGHTGSWNTAANWSQGVPDAGTDATIPAAPAGGSFPVVDVAAASTRNLTIEAGASLDVAGNALSVAGTLTNNGTLRQTQTVNDGSGDVAFLAAGSYGGVILNVDGTGLGLGSTEVVIDGNQAACNADDSTIHRCFEINPTNSTGRSATATFFFDAAELNGSDCSTVNVHRWNGSGWDTPETVGSRDCAGSPQSVTVINVSDFSPFGLSSGTPTALALRTLQIVRAGGWPVWLWLVASIGASATFIVLSRRDRRE